MNRRLAAIDARAKIAFLAAFLLATLHAATAPALGLFLAVAVLLAAAAPLRPRELRAVLVPLAPILVFTAVMQALAVQEGAVVFAVGAFAVTDAALATTARMLACLAALMLASVAFMHVASAEELVDTLRWGLAPLRRFGVRGDAFVLALSVALGFLPVLVGEFRGLRAAQMARLARFDGGVRDRLAAYARLFAPLLHSAFGHADRLADAFLARGFSAGPAPTSLHSGRFAAPEAATLACAAALLAATFLL